MALFKKLFTLLLGIGLLQTGAFNHYKCSPEKGNTQSISQKSCVHQKTKSHKEQHRRTKGCKSNCCDFLANLPILIDKEKVAIRTSLNPNYHHLDRALRDYLSILRRPPKHFS